MNKMFSISEAASLAIHSLAIIAKSKEQINVNGIAEATNFSRTHLAKVLQRLSKHNYIRSERGPKGGFIMAKDSNKITLLEVYELIEGKLKPDKCNIHDGKCPFNACIFSRITDKFTLEFRNYLKSKAISDFVS
jgi:Rrf2 family protein